MVSDEQTRIQLKQQTASFLQDLRKAQAELLDLQPAKQVALVEHNWSELHDIEQREQVGQDKLQALLTRRRELLAHFRATGGNGESIQAACRSFQWDQQPAWRSLLDQIRTNTETLRSASWSMWVMSQRASRFYGQMLSLISNGGRKATDYQEHPEAYAPTGGALFDASI